MLEAECKNEARVMLPFPIGARALLPDEAERRRDIETAIVASLVGTGYREVILPVLDFAEPYAGVIDRGIERESYRLIDREGELLTLRADFTPMAARAVAPRLRDFESPLRIFYRGDVVRCESARLGSNREYFQIGAELVGDPSMSADAEIVGKAIEAASVADENLTVSLGDAMIARLAMSEAGGVVEQRLADGTLDLEAAQRESSTQEAARRLGRLVQTLESVGVRVVVTFDAKDATGYYSGIRFSIYGSGARSPIVRGGRYDSLYGCFGFDAPAVGFTLNVDALEALR